MIALSLDLIHFVIALAFGFESSNLYVCYETFVNCILTVQKALCLNMSANNLAKILLKFVFIKFLVF